MVNTLYPPLVVGGAEKSVSLLAEALARSGDEVSVATLHPGRTTEVEERNGVRVYRLPLANIYWPFGRGRKRGVPAKMLWHLLDCWNPVAARRFGRVLDAEKPDVVHTNNVLGFSAAIFGEVKRRRIRLVHTLRDYSMVCARGTLFRDGRICERRCADCALLTANRKLLSRRVDAVVANSEYVLGAHEGRGWFRGVPGEVIYNIAEAAKAGAAAKDADDGDFRDDDTLIFGFIGKIEEEKGIEVLLRATELIGRPGWRLRIAGKGLDGYVAALRRRFADERIEWLGFAEPGEFYRSIDVSVIASVWAEPLPRTLIETFAAGKSAICTRSGGIPEIALLGKVVAMYDANDAGALAGLMNAAMDDGARWRDGGWRNEPAGEVFSAATIADRYRSVYGVHGIVAEDLVTIEPGRNLRAREMV